MEIVRIRRWVEIYNIDFQRREKREIYRWSSLHLKNKTMINSGK